MQVARTINGTVVVDVRAILDHLDWSEEDNAHEAEQQLPHLCGHYANWLPLLAIVAQNPSEPDAKRKWAKAAFEVIDAKLGDADLAPRAAASLA